MRSYRSQADLTLRTSTSRDKNNSETGQFNKDLDVRIEHSYVDQRENTPRVRRNDNSSFLIGSNQNPLTNENNQLNREINYELKMFVDNEIRENLKQIKNDFYYGQLRFEQKINDFVGKNPGQQAFNKDKLEDYVLKRDFQEKQESMMKVIQDMDTIMNKFLNQQNKEVLGYKEKIEGLMRKQNLQEEEYNLEQSRKIKDLQKQIEQLNAENSNIQQKLVQYDEQSQNSIISINKPSEEIAEDLKNLKIKFQQETQDLQKQNVQKHEELQRKLSIIDEAHEYLKKRLDKPEGSITLEELKEKIKHLEELIAHNESLTIIDNLIKRVDHLQENQEQDQVSLNDTSNKLTTKIDEIQELKEAVQQVQSEIDNFKEYQETTNPDLEDIKQKLETLDINYNFQKDLHAQASLDSSRIDVSQVKTMIEPDLKSIAEQIEQLRQKLNSNVQRIDNKDKSQDQRLDKLNVQLINMSDDFGKYKKDVINKFREFNETIIKDLEAIEEKCFNSLQRDILKKVNFQVKDQVHDPLNIRIEAIEKELVALNSQLMLEEVEEEQEQEEQILKEVQAELIEEKKSKEREDKSPHSVSDVPEITSEEIMNEKLLSEVKNQKKWYLRKTPQDFKIEEIMEEKHCSLEKAEQIYLQEFEQMKILKSQQESPNRSPPRLNQEDISLKEANENVIYATTSMFPLDQVISRDPARSLSRQPPPRANDKVSGITQNNRSSSVRQDVKNRPRSTRPEDSKHIYEEGKQRSPYFTIESALNDRADKIKPYKETRFPDLQASDLMEEGTDESNLNIQELDSNEDEVRQNMSFLQKERFSYTQSIIDRERTQEKIQTKQRKQKQDQSSNQEEQSTIFTIIKNPLANVKSYRSFQSPHRQEEQVEQYLQKVKFVSPSEEKKVLQQRDGSRRQQNEAKEFEHRGSHAYDYKEDIIPPADISEIRGDTLKVGTTNILFTDSKEEDEEDLKQ